MTDLRAQKRKSFLGQSFNGSATSVNRIASNGTTHHHPHLASQQAQQQGPIHEDQAALANPDIRTKLVVVGDGGSGKTSLLTRYVKGEFSDLYVPTVFENYIKMIRRKDKVVELALWDTAGQEEYDRLRALSYPETDLILACFSLDNPISLENVHDKWIPEVSHYCPDIPFILVGLKSDIRETQQTIAKEEAISLAHKWGASAYFECSAKTGANVAKIFQASVKIAINPHERPILNDASKLGLLGSADHSGPSNSKRSAGTSQSHTTTGNYQHHTANYNSQDHAESGRRKKKRHCLIL